MTVLDASFLIQVDRGLAEARELQRTLEAGGSPLRIPAIAWVEYLVGATASWRRELMAFSEAGSLVAPFDRVTADRATNLQMLLLQMGRRLAWNDLQIAATALQFQEPLVTFDRDFDDIPGLEVLHP